MRDFTVSRRAFVASAIVALPAVSQAAQGARDLYRDARAPVADRVKDLLARMTLDEKVAQMRTLWMDKARIVEGTHFSPAKAATELANGIGQLSLPNDLAGTSFLTKEYFRDPADGVAFINAVQRHLVENTRLGIPALFNEETAHGAKVRGATIFPNPLGLGSTWDTELIEQVFSVAGREARLRGATVGLSPVLDLARDPRYGRVEEFFGEDPYLVAQMGIASVRGQQGPRPLGRDKVFACLKHFVHGTPLGGLNTAPAEFTDRTLREAYLIPFERVIKMTAPAVIMPSYNEVNGIPSHASVELLQRTGRDRLGFKGAYFSDFGGITNLVSEHHMAADNKEAALQGITAGVDMEMPDGAAYKNLPELVKAGKVPESAIDMAVSRILALKFEAGLFENPYTDERRAIRNVNMPADIALARKAAQKSIILLQNDGVLPLDPAKPMKLAVIGPNAQDPLFGGYSGENAKAVGVLAGVKAAAGPNVQVSYAEGVRIINATNSGQTATNIIKPVPAGENDARIAEAVRVAEAADIILLVVGDRPEITREMIAAIYPGDRRNLNLYGDQDRLVEAMIATGKPIVSLLLNGRPLTVNRLAEKANALLEGWYLGQEGGNAFADILFGKVNPGGKLTVTFPANLGDLPVYYNKHPSSQNKRYVEGKPTPLFPFGYGISYTTFDISAPRLAQGTIGLDGTAIVEVDITNTGARVGDEVVQIYVRDDVSSAPRPILELRGFQRVTLKPGEKRTLRFELEPDAFAFWNIDMRYVVEPGDFTIYAGPNSASLKSAKLTVA
ncbi:glycoside hydrolase family 3 N-terminal domain-containing protein [Sphingobium sp. CAP-1]|uniref:glycoside hydrolase family 3 N-terminal domain-containing protein n=1 Tax=Sphingobium sp. CAP-1 TaxID=2676077 RepID=UPI001E5935EB|nr:glycoside hydrolase family 3 N-terminal domain-containing protein [Sphingobium sp. CAP-1]